jgi:hypothetical protein
MSDIGPDQSEIATNKPERKKISDLKPEELEQYYQIPGWRVWESNFLTRVHEDESSAIKIAESKPLSLIAGVGGIAWKELGGNPFKRHANPFLLEPLNQEEVDQIENKDQRRDFVSPDKFKNIIQSSQAKATE